MLKIRTGSAVLSIYGVSSESQFHVFGETELAIAEVFETPGGIVQTSLVIQSTHPWFHAELVDLRGKGSH